MPTDRMAAYEAPRPEEPKRQMREIELRFHGRTKQQRRTVLIPKAMNLPDVITYEGRAFVPSADGTYTEATMWPILKELDQ